MSGRPAFGSRLAARIYLVGLTQFAVVAAGLFILHASHQDGPGPGEKAARHVAVDVARVLAIGASPREELERARADFHVAGAVIDPDGAVVASTFPAGGGGCDRRVETQRPTRACFSMDVAFADGRAGKVEVLAPDPPRGPPRWPVVAIVLFVVGVSSLLLARWLARPLRRLSETASAFGEGDLGARVALAQRDELGDVGRAFDLMADRVTVLLRAERELLANVSHELRTPLARIRMAFGLISDGDAAALRDSIADVGEDLDELERLVSDILTAARLDLGAEGSALPPLQRASIDVHDLLTRSAAKLRALHPARPLVTIVEGDLPRVVADPVLLRRAIDNLLENAHKYDPREDQAIDLSARHDGGAIVIDVRDRGVGIGEADLTRVFRPFFRVDPSRSRATGGIGLGLALAKRIVEAHGGSIELTSALGRGTRARVRLPIERS